MLMTLLSAITGVNIAGQSNTILTPISLVVLICLASKNAFLIAEFAKQKEDAGKSLIDAAIDADRLRLRPILVTRFAFILGVVPLIIASGAGAEMRNAPGVSDRSDRTEHHRSFPAHRSHRAGGLSSGRLSSSVFRQCPQFFRGSVGLVVADQFGACAPACDRSARRRRIGSLRRAPRRSARRPRYFRRFARGLGPTNRRRRSRQSLRRRSLRRG